MCSVFAGVSIGLLSANSAYYDVQRTWALWAAFFGLGMYLLWALIARLVSVLARIGRGSRGVAPAGQKDFAGGSVSAQARPVSQSPGAQAPLDWLARLKLRQN
jgi:hypothetical protein